jgi:AcrR family transcriptional regulator
MPTSPAAQGRTGRPRLTSKVEIVAAARQLIDRDGWEKLTIRRLGAELGIGATTLYHHVRDKEDLLVLLLSDYIGQIEHPELPDDPRDRIIEVTLAMHDALAAWPWAAEVLTVDGFIARLDESALWSVEVILAGAIDHGCTPDQAVYVFRSIWYYTVGEILVRARSRKPDSERPISRPTDFDNLKSADLPNMSAVSDRWGQVAGQNTYPDGLRALVDGLLAQATTP